MSKKKVASDLPERKYKEPLIEYRLRCMEVLVKKHAPISIDNMVLVASKELGLVSKETVRDLLRILNVRGMIDYVCSEADKRIKLWKPV